MKTPLPDDKLWVRHRMRRREFLRRFGIASSAITLSPFFLERFSSLCAQQRPRVPVFLVKNGDCFQNIAKLWELMGGVSRYVGKDDVVVIKGNAQWANQGYTHTGCIKGVVDEVLKIPGYSGEVLICDNVQGGAYGPSTWAWNVTPDKRIHNWPDHNWTTLAAEYQAAGKPVAAHRWESGTLSDWSGPSEGPGWVRELFDFKEYATYLSYPVFQSPMTPGRLIDMKQGIWEGSDYTGRRVRTIFMPTLNNHGWGSEDYAGITSAVKSFFGATEIHSENGTWDGRNTIHSVSYTKNRADYAGEMVAHFIRNQYAPHLYITTAMWVGHESRTGGATETKTVLACENPVTLDYVGAKEVISPYASFLNPDLNNNTRKQLLGCMAGGVGTIDPTAFEVIRFDFENPRVTRLDVERKIRNFKAGQATEQDVKDAVRAYMDSP